MADYSFDIISKFDTQEVDNALQQTNKELNTRYDFRGTEAQAQWSKAGSKEGITLSALAEDRVKAASEVLIEKLVRRGIDPRALNLAAVQQSGKTYSIAATLQQGIASDEAKKITKLIRDEGAKGIKTQIMGDEIRVSGKSRDDLQGVIALLKGAKLDVALQFVNYR